MKSYTIVCSDLICPPKLEARATVSVMVRDPPTCVPVSGGSLIGGGAVEAKEDGKKGGKRMKELEEVGEVENQSLRPVSVIPNSGSLLFLNPAVLVAVTTML